MASDGRGGANGWNSGGGEIEGGLCGALPKTGAGAAGEDIALDADYGTDEGRPLGVGEGAGGIEDSDAALLLAAASPIATAGC